MEEGSEIEGRTYLRFLGCQSRENLNLTLIELLRKEMVIFGYPLDGVEFLFSGIAYTKVLNKNFGKATTADHCFALHLISL